MLAMVTGFVPSPLTRFILSYALAMGKLAVGLAAVGGMLAGVVVTLVTFTVAAVAARAQVTSVQARTEWFGWWFEFVRGVTVLVLGLAMLSRTGMR